MAFEPKNFVICSKFPLFRASCNLWLYTTSDSLEDCLAENYFQPRMNTKNQDSPEVGDIIQCIVGGGTLAYLTITAKTEKPYNITVEKTYLENEAEIYETIYLAADKGEQLYQTGVWYAKMYSDTVVPTGSEYEDRNYADFSQVDSDNNPIIVIYECQSGEWVEIQRITPPTEYNGYLPVTSKFWDIEEQTGQQGGEVLWSFNTKRFTPFPRIISYDSIHITGDSTVEIPDNPGSTQIVNKDYVDDAIAAIPIPTVDVTQSIDAEIVGTLTITDNSVVSGFSENNYLGMVAKFNFHESDSFEVCGSFTTSSDMSKYQYIFEPKTFLYGISILVDKTSQCVGVILSNSDNFPLSNQMYLNGTTVLSASTKYWVKVVYDGTNYKLYLSSDGQTYNQEDSQAATLLPESCIYSIGQVLADPQNYIAPTSIDMTDWYVKYNNELLWVGMDAPGLRQRVAKGHEVIAFQAPSSTNNYTWYRKYADGWVEQGGLVTGITSSYTTITIPVEMADTNYTLLTNTADSFSGSQYSTANAVSTTSFQIKYSGSGTAKCAWQVSGMAA